MFSAATLSVYKDKLKISRWAEHMAAALGFFNSNAIMRIMLVSCTILHAVSVLLAICNYFLFQLSYKQVLFAYGISLWIDWAILLLKLPYKYMRNMTYTMIANETDLPMYNIGCEVLVSIVRLGLGSIIRSYASDDQGCVCVFVWMKAWMCV